jgi:hypothetical protein
MSVTPVLGRILRLRPNGQARRRGAAAVELAVVSPLLIAFFLWILDFSRVYYFSLTIANCARNGAYYESLKSAPPTGSKLKNYNNTGAMYGSIEEAALADWPSWLEIKPTVTSNTGQDADGDYVDVTMRYPFKSATGMLGAYNDIEIERTVRMRVIK